MTAVAWIPAFGRGVCHLHSPVTIAVSIKIEMAWRAVYDFKALERVTYKFSSGLVAVLIINCVIHKVRAHPFFTLLSWIWVSSLSYCDEQESEVSNGVKARRRTCRHFAHAAGRSSHIVPRVLEHSMVATLPEGALTYLPHSVIFGYNRRG